MKPYFEREGITIYHGDCREVLSELQPVGGVVTDPPYGLGVSHWDQSVPYDLLPTLLDLTAGPVLWFGAASAILQDAQAFAVPPQRTLIWAPRFTLNHTKADGLYYRWHPIHAWQLPQKHEGPRWDLLDHPTGRHEWWEHGCTKPIALLRELVGFTATGATVLDPFMGSGTTLRAAMDLGRRAIGIEVNEAYCEIAARRLEQLVLPLEMEAAG